MLVLMWERTRFCCNGCLGSWSFEVPDWLPLGGLWGWIPCSSLDGWEHLACKELFQSTRKYGVMVG